MAEVNISPNRLCEVPFYDQRKLKFKMRNSAFGEFFFDILLQRSAISISIKQSAATSQDQV
jgi:hypothetical protein